jgi:hypothetical protein
VVYYLLLQDRVEEGMNSFSQVDAKKLATRLQYDYFDAYVDFYKADPAAARKIAQGYKDYPVDRWRKRFANVVVQADEIEGKAGAVVNEEDRNQVQAKLAATQPGFDFTVEARKVTLNYQNLETVTVNYYLMDVELLFSQNPFLQEYSGQFAYIKPNDAAALKLDAKKKQTDFDLPAKFHNSNVMVEIVGAGVRKSKAYYANDLAVQVVENYGQVHVTDQRTGKPLSTVYVKVYAKTNAGVRFFKDGYTDLRGRFEYASLTTDELISVEKFSILILSEDHGAIVREADPPKR